MTISLDLSGLQNKHKWLNGPKLMPPDPPCYSIVFPLHKEHMYNA